MTTSTRQFTEFNASLLFLQNQLVSRSLLVLLAIITLGFSHLLSTGWQNIYYSHLLIGTASLLTWFLRDRLATRPMAAGLIALICCYAASTLIGLGLATAGLPVFIAAAVICLLFFGNYSTLILAVLAVLISIISGIVLQQLSLPMATTAAYSTDTSARTVAWAAVIVSSLLFIPVIAEYVRGLRQAMLRQMDKTVQESAATPPQFDPLTGLPLLPVALDRLQHELHRASRNSTQGSVMFIDIDNFQVLNQEFGNEGGNRVLRTLAARITSVIRASDTLCRIGGDAFVAIFADQKDEEQTRLIARKLQSTVSHPITFQNQSIDITVSVGVATFPEHSVHPQELLQLASEALEQVKQNGGDSYRITSLAI